tara:strand:- start:602 stop:1015 length:414 start_codon:yes stop_codon:yes gene_type:complete
MAAVFPSMKPSSRSFAMGDVPSTTYTSLSGVVFRRAYGNKQTGHTLNLTFKNVGDTSELKSGAGTAKEIVDHYVNCNGTFESFLLPDRLFDGMSDGLEGLIQAPSNIKWRYASAPSVQSVVSGVSTVSVRLIGEIEA